MFAHQRQRADVSKPIFMGILELHGLHWWSSLVIFLSSQGPGSEAGVEMFTGGELMFTYLYGHLLCALCCVLCAVCCVLWASALCRLRHKPVNAGSPTNPLPLFNTSLSALQVGVQVFLGWVHYCLHIIKIHAQYFFI